MSICFPQYIFTLSCFLTWFQPFQHVSLLFSFIYCFDVVGLAFLGQDMPKFYVCDQIHVPMCFLLCSCLDLLVYVLLAMLMFIFISLCALCHVHMSKSTCWLLCHVLLQPFCLLMYLFSMFWPFRQGVDLDIVAQAYIHTPRPISKGLDHFLYVCLCLLASMLYLYDFLSRSRHCHALCLPQACSCRSLGPHACVVASIPLVAYLDVTTCEYTSVVLVYLMHTLSPLREMLCLPCLLCATHLAFFASLHLCMLAYMFMHESVCRPYSNLLELWTPNPNLHLSSQNALFCLITCLFAPIWHLLIVCLLACFPSTCFLCHCMYMRGAWTLGARVRPPRHKQKGHGCKQERQGCK